MMFACELHDRFIPVFRRSRLCSIVVPVGFGIWVEGVAKQDMGFNVFRSLSIYYAGKESESMATGDGTAT